MAELQPERTSVERATVRAMLPNRMLLVETDGGERVSVHAAGPMRVRVVRVLPGDQVMIERSPLDATKGRIVGV